MANPIGYVFTRIMLYMNGMSISNGWGSHSFTHSLAHTHAPARARLTYAKWGKRLSVYASTRVLLKRFIWRQGHGNSSVLPGSLHPGWTAVTRSPPLVVG